MYEILRKTIIIEATLKLISIFNFVQSKTH